MKEFNLAEWQTGNYDVATRDGREVKNLIQYNGTYIGIIEGKNTIWDSNGINTILELDDDLMLIEKEMYVNVYEDNNCGGRIYFSKNKAEKNGKTSPSYKGTYKLVKV